MAKLLKVDGTVREVRPIDGKKFGLTELQEMVGGTIDIQVHPTIGKGGNRQAVVLNDNGLLERLPINEAASRLWREWYPIEKYPHNNTQMLVGDVLVCAWGQIR